eukprot:COSAG05_NODE_16526_length_344_cov_0.779592_1_plen_24_part_10
MYSGVVVLELVGLSNLEDQGRVRR